MFDPLFITPAGEARSPEELVRSVVTGLKGKGGPEVIPAPYGDLAEKIVRAAACWQDEASGRIIDPLVCYETPTATARYTGALGALMLQGRCRDLAESCRKALEAVLSDLAGAETNYGEFFVKESLFAFMALKDHVSQEQYTAWEKIFAGYDPETAYGCTRTKRPDPESRQNFLTFSLAGEAMKKYLKLADNDSFIESYLEEQLARFDELGMYRDPGSPVVYDITARMNLEIAEFFSLKNSLRSRELRSKLRSGAFCSLLYQSPSGEMPFGGRSNQQNFVEASFALICEIEARHCKEEKDFLTAGVFRRAAALAVHSVKGFLDHDPIRFNKNRFPPETQHGRQLSYGFYAAYTLLCAGQLAMAGFFADETIAFAENTPAENGTFLWRTSSVFHKLFANVQGSHLEMEFCNDTSYDAVGWGRWHIRGIPAEYPLSTPVPEEQKFVSVVPAAGALAFGPGTAEEGFVSGLQIKDLHCCKLHSVNVKEEEISFVTDWPFSAGAVSEKITLKPSAAQVEAVDHTGGRIRYQLPLLLTDGESWSVTEETEKGFDLFYKGFCFSVSGNGAEKVREKWIGASRNGLYMPLRFDSPDNKIKVDLSIKEESSEK